MTGADQDKMLREAARSRGFRLVKSRRRKPGADFGRYGLIGLDSGRECFGFGEHGLTGDADAVLAYLRGGETAAWKRSLMGVVTAAPAAKKGTGGKGAKAAGESAKSKAAGATNIKRKEEAHPAPPRTRGGESQPDSPPALAGGAGGGSPPSEPRLKLAFRPGTPKDAKAIAKLLDTPHPVLSKRLKRVSDSGGILVAERRRVVGTVAWALVPLLDGQPVAHITHLKVAADVRREGIGRALVEAAAAAIRRAGADRIELSLAIDFAAPTGFLRKTGWQRSANGFARAVAG
jgi:ribosomal protein S18 acetylase RimI-like enzyme